MACFERLLEAAEGAGASALLVAGRLVDPGPLDPALLGALARLLSRDAKGALAVVTTVERDEDPGWLAALDPGSRLKVLACPGAAAAPPPEIEPRKGLAVVGLGRPAGPDALLRRA